MPNPEYPKRPNFFAHQFVRLLLKACVANEIGSDGFALLVAIVHTEDARGYRGPVSFWNGQLYPLIGCNSDSAFRRLRDRVVSAGWLHYQPGTKIAAPTYWVIIPSIHADWDDKPTDDSPDDRRILDGFLPKNDQESVKNPAAIRRRSGGETNGIPPIPIPIPNTDSGFAERSNKRPRDLLFDAIAEITASDPTIRSQASQVAKTAAALRKANPPYTPEEVRRFGEIASKVCSWIDGRRPTIGEVEKYIARVRDTSSFTQGTVKTKPARFTRPSVVDQILDDLDEVEGRKNE
jgi:hypothetical protein